MNRRQRRFLVGVSIGIVGLGIALFMPKASINGWHVWIGCATMIVGAALASDLLEA